MSSKAMVARALAICLMAVPAAHAQDRAAFGPEIAGLRLGMSPEQAREAILARAGVTEDEVRKLTELAEALSRGEGSAEDVALQARLSAAHPGFTIHEMASAEYTRACRTEAIAGGSDPAYQPSERCPRARRSSSTSFGLADIEPRRGEIVRVLSATYFEDLVSNSYQVTFTTEPGRQKVSRIQFRQTYPAGQSDKRPTLKAHLESLTERFGKPLHCVPPHARGYRSVPPNAETTSKKMQEQACFWPLAGAREGEPPARVDPSIAYLSCNHMTQAFPSLSLPVGFTLKDAEAGGRPKGSPSEFSTIAVCGEAIVIVPALTNDPVYEGVVLDQLEIDARWLRAELADKTRVERAARADAEADRKEREDALEAERRANKNKPKF